MVKVHAAPGGRQCLLIQIIKMWDHCKRWSMNWAVHSIKTGNVHKNCFSTFEYGTSCADTVSLTHTCAKEFINLLKRCFVTTECLYKLPQTKDGRSKDMKHIITTPYHSQVDGLLNRFHETPVISVCKLFIKYDQNLWNKDWKEFLLFILLVVL